MGKTKEEVATDYATYVKNRSAHTPEELEQYADQWVAWSPDGTAVLAHHADLAEVAAMIKATGMDTDKVHLEWLLSDGEAGEPR